MVIGGSDMIPEGTAPSIDAACRGPNSGVVPARGACRSTPSGSPSTGRATGDGSRSGDEPRGRLDSPFPPPCPGPRRRRGPASDRADRVGGRAGYDPIVVPELRAGQDLVAERG